MRTIKFRGKSNYDRRWIIGALVPNGKRPCIAEFGKLFELTEVDYESVGQFTGVFDCNGKEVYEGDIVLAKSAGERRRCQVVYAEHSCGFILHTKIDPWYIHADIDTKKDILLEVIGNIYDNPELLKGGTK